MSSGSDTSPAACPRIRRLMTLLAIAAWLPGCIANQTTRADGLVGMTPSSASMTVVRLLPGDDASGMAALRVSNALVSLSREKTVFGRTAYVLDEGAASAEDSAYLLRGVVTCGPKSSIVNTNLLWKILLRASFFFSGQAPGIGDHNYDSQVKARVELVERKTGRLAREFQVVSKAKGVYGETNTTDVEERVGVMAEHNLAAMILRKVSGHLVGKR